MEMLTNSRLNLWNDVDLLLRALPILASALQVAARVVVRAAKALPELALAVPKRGVEGVQEQLSAPVPSEGATEEVRDQTRGRVRGSSRFLGVCETRWKA